MHFELHRTIVLSSSVCRQLWSCNISRGSPPLSASIHHGKKKPTRINGQLGSILIGNSCFSLNIISNILILARNKSKDIVILKTLPVQRTRQQSTWKTPCSDSPRGVIHLQTKMLCFFCLLPEGDTVRIGMGRSYSFLTGLFGWARMIKSWCDDHTQNAMKECGRLS